MVLPKIYICYWTKIILLIGNVLFIYFTIFIEVYLFCNIVLVFGLQQNNSDTHIHISIYSCSYSFPYGLL